MRRGNEVLKNAVSLAVFAALREPNPCAQYDCKICQCNRHNHAQRAPVRRRSDVLCAMLGDGSPHQLAPHAVAA